jgi:YjbE family integral membrane protein
MFDLISPAELWALASVIMIDVVLAGDNAVVVGVAAAGLPREQRARVIAIGIAAATVLRILFASVTTQLLQIIGLLLAGGLLLLWVSWKLWRELEAQRRADKEAAEAEALADPHRMGQAVAAAAAAANGAPVKTFGQAVTQIVVADVSMSLDNVLAVAGAAMEHPWVLILGLALSVALMGMAAAIIAALLARHRWIAYIGLLIILYVALRMIWDGADDVLNYVQA